MTKNIVYDNSNLYLIYYCIYFILLFNYSRIYIFAGVYICWCIFAYIVNKYPMGLQSTAGGR